MQIIEHFTQSKYAQAKYARAEKNEDAIVITDDFVAVIDGATDLSGLEIDGMTPGRYAAQTVAAAIETLPRDIDGYGAFDSLSLALKTDKESRSLPEGFNPFCVAAIYSKNIREIFYLRDVQVKINGTRKDRPIKAIEPITTYRQSYLNAMLESGIPIETMQKDDPFHPLLKDFCIYSPALLNNEKSDFGFAVINGQSIPRHLIEIITVPAGSDLIITSDGYPTVPNNLAQAESDLKDMLENDPLCIGKYPQPRGIVPNGISFDDRSWVKIKT